MQQYSGVDEEVSYGKDTMYEELCMEDVDLTFENYEELFGGGSQMQPGQLFDDAGIDTYFEMKEASGADSNRHADFGTEVSILEFLFWGFVVHLDGKLF